MYFVVAPCGCVAVFITIDRSEGVKLSVGTSLSELLAGGKMLIDVTELSVESDSPPLLPPPPFDPRPM